MKFVAILLLTMLAVSCKQHVRQNAAATSAAL